MDLKAHIKRTFDQIHVIQLATVGEGGQPWCCNVHAIADDDLNIYWVSRPDRRHSKEIAANPLVAAAAAVRTTKPLLGVQIEGSAQIIEDHELIATVMEQYAAFHGSDPAWVHEIKSGENPHKLYRITPSMIAIFDQTAFPNNPRQEWRP